MRCLKRASPFCDQHMQHRLTTAPVAACVVHMPGERSCSYRRMRCASCMQSQSITVDRQMRRYDVPRLAFINKCDRAGADPWKAGPFPAFCAQHWPLLSQTLEARRPLCRACSCKHSETTSNAGDIKWESDACMHACAQVIGQMREKLRLNCAPVQLPIGLEDDHKGLVDLIKMKAFHFLGPNGETIQEVRLLLFAATSDLPAPYACIARVFQLAMS